MRRGTTPTIPFQTSVDLSGYERVVLTIKSKGKAKQVDIERDRLEFAEGGFSVTLTQEETLAFSGKGECQVRFADASGYAGATSIAEIDFDRILKEGVIGVDDGAD